MPHLSPMMWMYMLILVWLLVFMMNSNTWWMSTNKIMINKKNKKLIKYNKWNW